MMFIGAKKLTQVPCSIFLVFLLRYKGMTFVGNDRYLGNSLRKADQDIVQHRGREQRGIVSSRPSGSC